MNALLMFLLLLLPQDPLIREAEPEKRDELLNRITQHGSVNALAVAPDGIFAAAGDSLRIWDAISGSSVAGLVGMYPSSFQAAAFSPDGTAIAGLSREGELNSWALGPLQFKASFIDLSKASATGRNKAHFGANANALAYSPDAKIIVSAAADSPPLKVWNAETGALLRTLAPPGVAEITALAFSPDGTILAFATPGDIRLVKAADFVPVRTIGSNTGRTNALAFSPSGDFLAAASDDSVARLWQTETGAAGPELKGHAGAVRGIAFSPAGDLVVTGSLDRTARVWDIEGIAQATIPHPRPVLAVAFSESGTELMTASADNTVRLWRVPDWKLTSRLVAIDQPPGSAFLFDRAAPAPGETATVVSANSVSSLKDSRRKAPTLELSALASQILRLIQSNQVQAMDGLLSGDDFTIDGSRLAAGGQVSLQDREGVLARLFDTNRLRALLAKSGAEDPGRFRSLRDIVQSEAGVTTEMVARPKQGNQEDAATLIIYWKQDPMESGYRDFAQFGIARQAGAWRIVDLTLPLDNGTPSRRTVAQQRLRQLRAGADRLIRSLPPGNEVLQRIVEDHEKELALEIRLAQTPGQWWAPDLDEGEVEVRWDGDPSEYDLKGYPLLRLHFVDGLWKNRQ